MVFISEILCGTSILTDAKLPGIRKEALNLRSEQTTVSRLEEIFHKQGNTVSALEGAVSKV